MSDITMLALGKPTYKRGDITKNTWVGARSARELERSVGYGQGRLSAGWSILVLQQRLTPDDFIFSGLTLRSGGRYGLPAEDPVADKARIHVHDAMLKEYGPNNVRDQMRKSLSEVTYEGPDRLVKIVPATQHSETMEPSKQYPMGGGGLQWTLIKPCRFLVAVQVDEHGIARTPNFSMFLGESARYDDRAKLAKYLESA